ncbi:negative regulation of SNARE complex assembly [Balamuthia mandrillaris]
MGPECRHLNRLFRFLVGCSWEINDHDSYPTKALEVRKASGGMMRERVGLVRLRHAGPVAAATATKPKPVSVMVNPKLNRNARRRCFCSSHHKGSAERQPTPALCLRWELGRAAWRRRPAPSPYTHSDPYQPRRRTVRGLWRTHLLCLLCEWSALAYLGPLCVCVEGAATEKRVYYWGSTKFRGVQPKKAAPAGGFHLGADTFAESPLSFAEGSPDLQSVCLRPASIPALDGLDITSIRVGRNHAMFLTKDGTLYGCGNGPYSGHPFMSARLEPTPLQSLQLEGVRIKAVACGPDHNLAVSEEGSLYVWGGSMHDQLGFGDSLTIHIPRLHDFFKGKEVTHVAAGLSHSLAVTNDRELWSWGDNRQYQLGYTEPKKQGVPKRVEGLRLEQNEKIVQVEAGLFHNVLLTDKGKVMTWGEGEFSQLGDGHREKKVAPPLSVPSPMFDDAAFISCGAYHTLLLTKSGKAIVWGLGSDYQLANSNRSNLDEPTLISVLRGVRSVAAGWAHSLFCATSLDTNPPQQ